MKEYEYIELRETELQMNVDMIGVHKLFKLRIPDGKVYLNYKRIAEFDFKPYKYIFVPNHRESHSDHRVILSIMKRLKLFGKLGKGMLIEYEVWTPLIRPNIVYNITEVVETKRLLISTYKSQLESINYVNKGLALSEYRGIYGNIPYGEAYSAYTFLWRLKYIYSRLPEKLKVAIARGFGKN